MSDVLYLIHGILMGLAWFFFAPLAIAASLARRCGNQDTVVVRVLNQDGQWYKIHLYSNILVVLLTLTGFVVIKLGGSDNGDRRRQLSEDEGEGEGSGEGIHETLGLTILALVLLQAFFGLIRPSIISGSSDVEKTTQCDTSTSDSDFDENMEPKRQDHQEHEDSAKKSVFRIVWEWSHRVVGMILLICAWVNCVIGISLDD
jgi:hypothetical protein